VSDGLFYFYPPSPPTPPVERAPHEADWAVNDAAVHDAAEPLSSNTDAWTDYRQRGDRLLRRDKVDERATRVRVREPLFPGDRVKVTRVGDGWEARRG
jgi:hypothetical protein